MDKLLKLLSENARFTDKQLAAMLALSEGEVKEKIEECERLGIINGYHALINWQSVDPQYVSAIIEVKVSPKRDYGFDEIARKIMDFPEVESLYLMSGGYDLAITVSGRSFIDVAMFVSKHLSPLDSVISTATHFVLKRYKDMGVKMHYESRDERGNFSL
jgi:DNA-binding Lrp family transcriptional regulator